MSILVYLFIFANLLLSLGIVQEKTDGPVTKKPNFIWIVAEDMSPDLGCYRCNSVNTPNIDQLAKQGVLFENAFVTGPACSPSRTALATGVFQTTVGAYHMRYSEKLKPILPKPYKTLPAMMKELGYSTGNIKKIGSVSLSSKDDWLFKTRDKGWDTNNWKKLSKKKPFFAQFHLGLSHRPFVADKSNRQVEMPPYYPNHQVSREDWANYLASVEKADKQVGKIMKELEVGGFLENTIVVFLSDHGRPMLRGKNWLYDSGMRIPLIVRFPNNRQEIKPTRSRRHQLVSTVDLVAQTIRWGNGKVPNWMHGKEIFGKATERKYVYGAIDRVGNIETCSRSIRSKRYKYIRNIKRPGSIVDCSTPYRKANHPTYHLVKLLEQQQLLGKNHGQLVERLPREELYDLQEDPHETRNLAQSSSYAKILRQYSELLDQWLESSSDKGLEPDSKAIQHAFEQYGVSTQKQFQKKIDRLRNKVKRQISDK